MKFEKYVQITLDNLNKEIERDIKVSLNTIPFMESPIYYESDYFQNLNDLKSNHPFALERIKDCQFVENITSGRSNYNIYRKVDTDCIWDFFISDKEGYETVHAFVKYKPKYQLLKIQGLWQIEYDIGLIKNLLKNYYSHFFSGIESDSVANNKGKMFFQNLAKDFIDSGKKVTVIFKDAEFPYDINKCESYWQNVDGVPNFEKLIRYYY